MEVVRTEDLEHGRVLRRTFVRQEVALDDHGLSAVLGALQKRLVQLSESIVRHAGEKVMRQVVVLTKGKDRKIDESIDKEDARIRQPAAVAVAMLHELTQDHEEA